MTKTSTIRLTGLLALAAALAAPTAFAQDTTTTAADQAQAAQPQPTTPNASQAPAEAGKKTWADLDINKDGNLDKAEAAPIPTLQAVFDTADSNADGALSGAEYKQYLAMNGDGKAKPKK